MDLFKYLNETVEEFTRAQLERMFRLFDKLIPGTFEGVDGRNGKMRLENTGKVISAPVYGGAGSIPKGERCYYDGKQIFIRKFIEEKKEEIAKKTPKLAPVAYNKPTVPDEIDEAPFTILGQKGLGWTSERKYVFSTPSGEFDAGDWGQFHSDTWPVAWKDHFKTGDFWLTTYDAPLDATGFYLNPKIKWTKNDPYNPYDTVFIVPYIHRYELFAERGQGVEFYFSTGQDVNLGSPEQVAAGSMPHTSEYQFFYLPKLVEWLDIAYPAVSTGGGFYSGQYWNGEGVAFSINNNAANIPYRIGDVVTMEPERQCMIDNSQPCFGRGGGWAPGEYNAYGPGGGSYFTLTTDPVEADTKTGDPFLDPIYGRPYVRGVSEPWVLGLQNAGWLYQYGRMVYYLTDPAEGANPTIGGLSSWWKSNIRNKAYEILDLDGGNWVVEDLDGNTPPLPSHPYGYMEDPNGDGGAWWYTSSRDGILWAYEVQMIYVLKDGVTVADAWASTAANPTYTGTFGPGSTTLCRQITDNEDMPGGSVDRPYGFKSVLCIFRVRVNTVTQQVDTDSFMHVDQADCIDGVGDCLGYWAADFEDVMLQHAWPDDPRVVDGLDFNSSATDYNYDPIRGWLWQFGSGYLWDNREESTMNCKYWVRPDDVEDGTPAFAAWVDSVYGNNSPDGEMDFPRQSNNDMKRCMGIDPTLTPFQFYETQTPPDGYSVVRRHWLYASPVLKRDATPSTLDEVRPGAE